MTKSPRQVAVINRANQLNPTQPVFHRSRGASPQQAIDRAASVRISLDNRAKPPEAAAGSSSGQGTGAAASKQTR